MASHFDFRVFDAFGNFHFLLAGEQRDLAHLLEVHADRVVEDVEFLVCLEFLLLAAIVVAFLVFEAVDFRGVDDVELHVAEALHDRLDIVRIDKVVGEDLVDVVVGQVFLFLGELDEFADLFLNFRGVDAAFFGSTGLACLGFGGWFFALGRGCDWGGIVLRSGRSCFRGGRGGGFCRVFRCGGGFVCLGGLGLFGWGGFGGRFCCGFNRCLGGSFCWRLGCRF